MRIIESKRGYFRGTHKAYEIEIEREIPPVESFGERHFYIRVSNDHGHAYDGYSPAGVATMAEAKREALYGSGLKERPSSEPAGVAE